MPFIGNNSNMSELLRKSILNASYESRLKIGLDNCVEHLYSCDPFKVLAVALTDTSTDIITQTILETFCYEHKIPFMKIDSRILKRFLKPEYMQKLTLNIEQDNSQDPYCVLILKPDNMSNYPDEVSLVNLINESELNNETLVILNAQCSSNDKACNDQCLSGETWTNGT